MQVNFVIHFCLLPATLAHGADTLVRGLHYVLIYVSYNEILLLLHLFHFLCKQHLHLSCDRLCMIGLDDCIILQPRHLVRSRLGGTLDLISVQNLNSHDFACMSSQAISRATKEHLAWCDLGQIRVSGGTQYPCNSGGSRSLNVWSRELRIHATWPRH
jgi:hypothetical protein